MSDPTQRRTSSELTMQHSLEMNSCSPKIEGKKEDPWTENGVRIAISLVPVDATHASRGKGVLTCDFL